MAAMIYFIQPLTNSSVHTTACNIRDAKRSFYRSANEIFRKIGRFAPENVTLQLIRFGLNVCQHCSMV